VRTDPLQRLHTLTNLAEALDTLGRKAAVAAASGCGAGAVPQVARTLRDSNLATEAQALRDAYLASRVADLAAQRAAFAKAQEVATGAGGGAKRGRKGSGRGKGDSRVAEFACLLAPGAAAVGGADGAEDGGDEEVPEVEEADEIDAAEVAALRDSWYIAAIDALERSGKSEEVAEAVKEALLEREQYERAGAQNATSLARRWVWARS
jgi:hypothetical protein